MEGVVDVELTEREFTDGTWGWISDLCIDEYAPTLSDHGLTSSSAFMEYDLTTLEDMPGWLLKAMQKRKENLLAGQGQCTICFDQLPAHAGIRCDGAQSHFICRDCLMAHVATESSPEKLDLLAKRGGIPCPVPDCNVLYTEQQLAQILPQDVYVAYVGAQHKVAEQRIEEAAKKGAEKDITDALKEIEDLEKKLAAAQTGKEVDMSKRIAKLRGKVIEDVLTLQCPRCNKAFIDFSGCQALTCSKAGCGCAFCAFCLMDCGADAHEHVFSVCAVKWGETDDAVKKAQRAWRIDRLKMFFNDLESDEVRKRLLEALHKDLKDLKIDPHKLLGVLGLSSGKTGAHGKGGKGSTAHKHRVVEIRDADPSRDNVRLRADACMHCPLGERLPNGTLVIVENEWAQIKTATLGVGYIKCWHIMPDGGSHIHAGGVGTVKDADTNFNDVRLRRKAEAKMFPPPDRRLPNGTKINVLDVWMQVRCQENEHLRGFVKRHHCQDINDGKAVGKGKLGKFTGKGKQVRAQQADGHPTVGMRKDPSGPVIKGLDAKNGEVFTVVGQIGDMLAVTWPSPAEISYVKALNVQPIQGNIAPPLFVLMQADGHPAVAARLAIDDEMAYDVPNGTVVECLAVEGEWMRVSIPVAGLKEAFIKKRNVANPP